MLLATHTGQPHEAGLDEAGRGCLAGPVFAAAVILPPDYSPAFLNDSKQVSARRRAALRADICANAIAWAVAEASPAEIQTLNIAQASYLAMHRAVADLGVPATHLLVDGNRFKAHLRLPHNASVGQPKMRLKAVATHLLVDGNRFKAHLRLPHTCIVGGDGLYQSIAAASILAKTFRDERMHELAAEFPAYGWHQNAGYPTAAHRAALREHGITPHHRLGFKLI